MLAGAHAVPWPHPPQQSRASPAFPLPPRHVAGLRPAAARSWLGGHQFFKRTLTTVKKMLQCLMVKKDSNRLPGILYLGTIIFGMCAQIIRSNVLVFGNDIPADINNSIFILRLAFFSDILMILFYLFTAWTLFNLLKHLNKNNSLLFFVFTIISVSIMSVNMINHIAIIEINSASYFNINSAYDLRSLSQFFSNLHKYGYLIAQIFFGLWLLPLGIIILESKIMSKYFGIMLIAATFGHLLEILITFLFPGKDLLTYPGLIIAMAGEFSFCFRLLFKGIKVENIKT
jgi:hypothetical protein